MVYGRLYLQIICYQQLNLSADLKKIYFQILAGMSEILSDTTLEIPLKGKQKLAGILLCSTQTEQLS